VQEVTVLSADNLRSFLGHSRAAQIVKVLPMAAQSDLVRLSILATSGGVWADADVFCVLPLDWWLAAYTRAAGMFAFRLKGRDRSLASWFLASTAGHELLVEWRDALLLHAKSNHNRFK